MTNIQPTKYDIGYRNDYSNNDKDNDVRTIVVDNDSDNKYKFGLVNRHKVHGTQVSSLHTNLFGASLLGCSTQTHIVGYL